MRAAVRFLADIWPSLVAALLAAVGGFLSLGTLGLLLYHLVSPALTLRFPPLPAWDQSLVWPVIVAVPVLWAPSFILAGVVNRQVKRRGWTRTSRIPLYLAIVWLAALAAWAAMLAANPTLWR